eukprot:5955174-Prorocentrum_lima.AAC.1
MIEDFHHFFNTMLMLPPPTASVEAVRSYLQKNLGGCDQHAGVFLLAGHVKCSWEETLKNSYNQREFK